MTLLGLIVALVVVGLVLWLVNSLPIDGRIKTIIVVVTILVILLCLLQALGGGNAFLNHRIG